VSRGEIANFFKPRLKRVRTFLVIVKASDETGVSVRTCGVNRSTAYLLLIQFTNGDIARTRLQIFSFLCDSFSRHCYLFNRSTVNLCFYTVWLINLFFKVLFSIFIRQTYRAGVLACLIEFIVRWNFLLHLCIENSFVLKQYKNSNRFRLDRVIRHY